MDNMSFMTVVRNTALGGLIDKKHQIKDKIKTS